MAKGGGGGYSVQLGALEQVAQEMQQYTTDINTTLDNLEAHAKSTLNEEHWAGSAKSAYTTAKANWDKAASSMKDKLHTSYLALIDIVEDYNQSEANALKAIDQTNLNG
jgi:WXG100 family type VII secretion target